MEVADHAFVERDEHDCVSEVVVILVYLAEMQKLQSRTGWGLI